MSGSLNDKITDTRNSARPNNAKVTVTRSSGGTTLTCDNLAGWPTSSTSKVHFVTYQIDSNSNPVSGTQCDWVGLVSGNTIGSLTLKDGTDNGNSIGDIVEMLPTAAWGQDLADWGTQEHDRQGHHTAVTATSVTTTGAVTSGAGVSGTTGTFSGDVSDNSTTLKTIRSETTFDFVASGCVWSGDSYGSTRNASMTSGVVYIGGKRVAVSSVTARAFTASKDTYVDVDNTGTLTYTEVTNNAASPSLAANSIRLAIIITGASNIANSGSVNQGQETIVLPIASSIPYSVTDSLGNLICPRDPQRKLLGYRQYTQNLATALNASVQVPGLECAVIVPTGRKVKITFWGGRGMSNNGTGANLMTLWDGVIGSGTQLGQSQNSGTSLTQGVIEATQTPSSTSKTYRAGFYVTAGTGTLYGETYAPAYIRVELQ